MGGKLLDPNWRPSNADVMYGIGLGLTTPAIWDIATDMALWCEANAHRPIAKKSNWSAAFKSWMRREAAKRKPPNGAGSATMDAFDKLIAAGQVGPGDHEGPTLDLTATGGGTGQATGRTSKPHANPPNPGAYSLSIAKTLEKYPLGVAEECCDPQTGLARSREFPPTVACIVEWCERMTRKPM